MGSIHKRRRGKWWRIQWVDGAGKLRTKTLTKVTELKVAETILAKLEHQAALERSGYIDPADAKFQREGRRPINEHIDDWQEHLKASKPSPKYDVHESNLVRRVMKLAGAGRLLDIVPGDVKRAIANMPRERGEGDVGLRQKNKALTACKMFCEQMRRDGKLRANPLTDVKGWNENTDKRRQHVAFDAELADAVIIAARHAPFVCEGLTGPQRAMLYLTAFNTGFRKRTCGELTVSHLHLSGPSPFIRILPSNVKNKKLKDHLIDVDYAAALRLYTKGMKPNERLFPFKHYHNTAEMMRRDLASIGVEYQASPTEFRDFHSWRNTFGTEMGRRASIKVVQDLMGHSTPVLTARYMRPTIADYREPLAGLPKVGQAKPRKNARTA